MTLLESILNTFTHLMGLDLFIEQDAPSKGLLDFATETHSDGSREWWGLGLHIVVSPLQVSPQN
jgi:hypothetical protein